MPSILKQVLELPRHEQLLIVNAVIDQLRNEDKDAGVPDWQWDRAELALTEVQDQPELMLSEQDFWEQIDRKIESL